MLRFLVIFFSVLFCGCHEKPLPPGTLACVNGELIHMSAVQALLDSRAASQGLRLRPAVSEMRSSYREALATLMAAALARQELAERGLAIDEKKLDEAVAQVKKDYASAGQEDVWADSVLREDEWRQLAAGQLALELLIRQVLAPAIKISLADIRAYYEEHSKEFTLPAWGRVCFLEGEKPELEAWCAAVDADNTSPVATCMDARLAHLPEPWVKNLARTGACGKIIEQEGHWRAVAVVSRSQPEKLLLSEAYGLIENILLAERRQAAFETWLEKKLAASSVLVNPELFAAEESSEF